uniref:Uncharacterized protein n=1 Tax=Anguilla anguilla TaxID=7936 RepID=A0A0E9XY25_ANGAN
MVKYREIIRHASTDEFTI